MVIKYKKWRARYSVAGAEKWLTLNVPTGYYSDAVNVAKDTAPSHWILKEVTPVRSTRIEEIKL